MKVKLLKIGKSRNLKIKVRATFRSVRAVVVVARWLIIVNYPPSFVSHKFSCVTFHSLVVVAPVFL